MDFPQEEFTSRRLRLAKQLSANGLVVIPSAPEKFRNNDVHFAYRPSSDFYYLSGFSEPGSVLALRSDSEFILFNRPNDPARERWDGPRAGLDGAKKIFNAQQSFSIDSIDEELPKMLQECKRLYYLFGVDSDFDKKILGWLDDIRGEERISGGSPAEIVDLGNLLHELRLKKSDLEIEFMRQAAKVAADGHIRAMKACRPGMMEYELEAELIHEFTKNGCRHIAYESIVGGGKNACVLHYVKNNEKLNDGELVLIDAGAEHEYYASDVTRTFPINGKFSIEQRAIYEIVLASQKAGINAVKPGVPFNQIQNIILEIVTEGLLELGILKGNVQTLIEEKAYLEFYMHNSGHWLGMDVHDVGAYKMDDEWRELEPGMCLTVEPGIYISAGNEAVDKKWWNIGIRIEDDVLVTESGFEILSSRAPKDPEEIEELMKG